MTMTRSIPSAGFTLVETLVAIAIVSIAVGGAMFGAARAIVAAQIARDQLTASYLAEEGIEYVRWMRDDAYLDAYSGAYGSTNISTIAWDNFLSGTHAYTIAGCRAPSICTLDPSQPMGYGSSLNAYAPPAPLYLVDGVYTQQSSAVGAKQTIFTRTIEVDNVPASNPTPNEVKVFLIVTWTERGSTYSVTITDNLTPWQ